MSQTGAMNNKAGEMQMEHVSISFGDKKILEDISLTITRGSFTCVCGPSGCGKTTLMNILAGYLKPDSGKCTFNGALVSGPSPDRLTVFQENTLFQWMSLWENTLFGPKIQGKNIEEAAKKARKLISLSGLNGFETKYPGQLSGGMQRRAELIRALINEPQILLMDEPFRGLDAMTRVMMQEYFLKVFETTQTTMLLISSELDEAIFMGDTVYLMSTMPTIIKKKMSVNLPRPRVLEHQTSMEFAEIQNEAFETMEAEALKSFELVPSV